MASKRHAPEIGTKSSPKKKQKSSTGQLNIHNFFSSPKKSVQVVTPSPQHEFQGDHKLAKELTEREGIGLEAAKRPQSARKNGQPDRKGKGKEIVELIDVDSMDSLGDSAERVIQSSSLKLDIPSEPDPESIDMAGPSTLKVSPRPNRSTLVQVHKQSDITFSDLTIDPLDFDQGTATPAAISSYGFIAHTLSSLSKTRSRLLIVNALTNCLRSIIQIHPSSLLPALYLMSNSVSPSYIPVELKIGPSIISKALRQVSGLTSAALNKLYTSLGDPGDVAFAAKSSIRTLVPHPPLTIIGVYETLLKIAKVQGQGASKTKQSLVERLLLSAKGEETRYIVRTLFQNLRVGAVRTTLITALARAMVFCPPSDYDGNNNSCHSFPGLIQNVNNGEEIDDQKTVTDTVRQEISVLYGKAESIVKSVFVIHPNLGEISNALLEVGLDRLSDRIRLTIGIPLHPALGSPMRSFEEIYERLGDVPFTAEFKYDGQRAQLHACYENGQVKVKIFSRHLEDMTDKYPDVVTLAQLLLSNNPAPSPTHHKAFSFILDAEIVAIDVDSGELKSFQELSQRARKDVKLEDVKIAVGVFAYDLMFLNGEPLIERSFRERRDLFRKYFPPLIPDTIMTARFYHVENCDSDQGQEAIEAFWKKAVAGRSEGLMIKVLDHGDINEPDSSLKKRRKPLPASYQPDKRTMSWLKLKKDYVSGILDSLDLVPVGAWYGNGRKIKWWSPILLAVWDHQQSEFVAVCKCMSGFSDKFYTEMKEKYAEESENCSTTPMWNCNVGGFRPTVYFKPVDVWEVRGADITISPVSVAARGLIPGEKGLSLRFPRFIKVREDKGPEEASSTEFLADLWRHQESRGPKTSGKPHDDDGDLVDVEWESEQGEEDRYEDS